tara:strand:- start:3670 stop:4275 length:606 start_codon:yes stop_codon:yes gene_type:complete
MQKKIINEILIGSNNKGKIKEIKDLLPKRIKILSPKDFKIKSPREIGKTFKQNSLLKAKYFSKKTEKICLSDDSGLEIDILKGLPGIYSARWGGEKNNFNLAISKVYREIYKTKKNWKNLKIKARFVCALTIYWPDGKFISSTGKVEGKISSKKKGNKGFGYDPIFIPSKKKITFGQMKPSIKYKIDHRFKAFKKLKNFFY